MCSRELLPVDLAVTAALALAVVGRADHVLDLRLRRVEAQLLHHLPQRSTDTRARRDRSSRKALRKQDVSSSRSSTESEICFPYSTCICVRVCANKMERGFTGM